MKLPSVSVIASRSSDSSIDTGTDTFLLMSYCVCLGFRISIIQICALSRSTGSSDTSHTTISSPLCLSSWLVAQLIIWYLEHSLHLFPWVDDSCSNFAQWAMLSWVGCPTAVSKSRDDGRWSLHWPTTRPSTLYGNGEASPGIDSSPGAAFTRSLSWTKWPRSYLRPHVLHDTFSWPCPMAFGQVQRLRFRCFS